MKKTFILLGILILAGIIVGIILIISPHNSNQNKETMKNTTSTSTGVQITVTTEGKGEESVVGDNVTVNYTGTFEDGKAFDSNVDPAFNHVSPLPFTLGAGQVIPGWDQGVTGMKVGEKRHLVIPPSLAYGPNGYGPIPGNSTLIFDVELLSITHK